MEIINMIALQSFIGSEGLIKAKQPFKVSSEGRAQDLEKRKLAERAAGKSSEPDEIPAAGPSETQEITPSSTQTAAPQQTPENAPDEAKANFKTMPLKELRKRAQQEKIKGYKSMSKGDLIDRIIVTLQSKGEL
jgi:hypothetical protein